MGTVILNLSRILLICILFIMLCVGFIYLLNRLLIAEKDIQFLYDYYEHSYKQIELNIKKNRRII